MSKRSKLKPITVKPGRLYCQGDNGMWQELRVDLGVTGATYRLTTGGRLKETKWKPWQDKVKWKVLRGHAKTLEAERAKLVEVNQHLLATRDSRDAFLESIDQVDAYRQWAGEKDAQDSPWYEQAGEALGEGSLDPDSDKEATIEALCQRIRDLLKDDEQYDG